MTGYDGPPSSSTSTTDGLPDHSPEPPSISCTACDERGRNGVSSVLASSTTCSVTCRTVRIRSGSDSRSFHGACSEKYLLASATVRIASVIANLKRELDRKSPTGPNDFRDVSKSAWSAS